MIYNKKYVHPAFQYITIIIVDIRWNGFDIIVLTSIRPILPMLNN